MDIRRIASKAKKRLLSIPLAGRIAGAVIIVASLAYGIVFIPTKQVDFSFASDNCFSHFLIAPDIHQSSSDEFTLAPKNSTKVGDFAIFSTQLCLEPEKSPDPGSRTVANAPFGGFLASKRFDIRIPDAPEAVESDFIGRTISTARPLEVALTAGDTLHRYTIEINDKQSDCHHEESKLICDVDSLNLEQGVDYDATLYREFDDDKESVIEGELSTVAPLKKTKSDIKNKKVVYNKPKSFSFTFDQPLDSAEVDIRRVTKDDAEEVGTTHEIKGDTLKVILEEHLARESSFKINLDEVIAKNGSSLDKPVEINFTTSGGPKVKAVSIGSSGVSAGSRIVLTFDQHIHDDVNLAKYIRTTGVGSVVSRISKSEVALDLQGGSDCKAFNVVVDRGIKSGSNDESSKEGWSHASRIACGYSWQIGTSVQGRPIIAYSFGSGSKVILFTAGIHGSEPSSTATMQAWVNYLSANAHIIPADKRVVVVPNTNPDGIAVGSRNNSNNVNLGRNFPTANWRADIETASGLLKNGGGKSPGSEPEAAALIKLTRQLRPRLEVSFHAQGSLVGANKFADSVAIGSTYASTVGYTTMFYNAEEVMGGYPMTGEYEDWMGEEMGIPAILIELPTHGGNYLSSQLPALRKMLAV